MHQLLDESFQVKGIFLSITIATKKDKIYFSVEPTTSINPKNKDTITKQTFYEAVDYTQNNYISIISNYFGPKLI